MVSSKKDEWQIPSIIYLYDEPSSNLSLKEIADYLEEKFSIELEGRNEFLSYHLKNRLEDTAKRLAAIKVRDLSKPYQEFPPLGGEVDFEKKLLSKPQHKLVGILYDGPRLLSLYRDLIPRRELSMRKVHLAFTNRLFGTFEEKDGRYHAHVLICGYPNIISTTGIVEAPAKPREFYAMKQGYRMLGISPPIEALKGDFKGRLIDYDDDRLTEVMKGYSMQSLLYHITGEPFCEEKECRLYDAHWQEEVIGAQLSGKEFCKRHERIIAQIRQFSEEKTHG